MTRRPTVPAFSTCQKRIGFPKRPTAPPDFPSRLGPAEVAAAVWLGCNTPERLAREWGITPGLAEALLEGAIAAGEVWVFDGRYGAPEPVVLYTPTTPGRYAPAIAPEGIFLHRKIHEQRLKPRRARRGAA